ncbi:hypothetical protein RLOC_00011867 [Lonchura striata]|uniref:Reverse transcriptase domain-containing protein n=1 Tax=Lonchura striata TaxID=40157 RepID=A0A218VD63_9PASE|nr:hypothetical protein RLOC_00011867 [Lonchura striata domestica]
MLLKTQFVAKSWEDIRKKTEKLENWQNRGLDELLREAQKVYVRWEEESSKRQVGMMVAAVREDRKGQTGRDLIIELQLEIKVKNQELAVSAYPLTVDDQKQINPNVWYSPDTISRLEMPPIKIQISKPHTPVKALEELLTEYQVQTGNVLLQYVDDLLIAGNNKENVRKETIRLLNFLAQKGLRYHKKSYNLQRKKSDLEEEELQCGEVLFIDGSSRIVEETAVRTAECGWTHASRLKGPVTRPHWKVISTPGIRYAGINGGHTVKVDTFNIIVTIPTNQSPFVVEILAIKCRGEVIIVPRLIYHTSEEVLRHFEGDLNIQKREPITVVTLATLLIAGGVGTGPLIILIMGLIFGPCILRCILHYVKQRFDIAKLLILTTRSGAKYKSAYIDEDEDWCQCVVPRGDYAYCNCEVLPCECYDKCWDCGKRFICNAESESSV